MVDIELLYRQQLTDSDLRLLREAAGAGLPVTAALATPAAEAAVFAAAGPLQPPGPLEAPGPVHSQVALGVSPFLAFAVAVHRTAARLGTASFVEERWGPRVRIPLFDVATLRALVADPLRRWFLVDLLASYTRVSSGVVWTRTARGWRRRRFSELDPASLAEQLSLVGPSEQAGVYRRLGDLALFLLGVFPDHLPSLTGAARDRLLRLSGVDEDRSEELDGRSSTWVRGGTARRSPRPGQPVTR